MQIKLALLIAVSVLVMPGQTPGTERHSRASRYTIQVASFPIAAEARLLVARLAGIGERVTTSVVDLPGRGRWTRVSVGTFETALEARVHAAKLVSRGVIKWYFVRAVQDRQETAGHVKHWVSASLAIAPVPALENNRQRSIASFRPPLRGDQRTLPLLKTPSLSLTPTVDTRLLPRPDPVRLAFLLINGEAGHPPLARQTGLWVTGDAKDGLARLRWIAGIKGDELVTLDNDGRVRLDTRVLGEGAGIEKMPLLERPLAVTDYICSNEGLLLLVQLTHGRYRYRLHLARQAPTRGAAIEVVGGVNLDNNHDSRINPNRRFGKKLDNERPPEGFDSLVAINPVARWFNHLTNQLVPGAHIAFHEMAEAHAKIEMGLEYLGDATRFGAHEVALEREKRLKSQRPRAGVVVTVGPNRVLRSEEEIREFLSHLATAR